VPNIKMMKKPNGTMKTERSLCAESDSVLLAVDVDIADDAWHRVLDDPTQVCQDTLAAAYGFLDYPARAYEVSVVLTDDARQRRLNAEYRGKDVSTNVLSFPSGEDADAGFPDDIALPLGDITLALETVQREAETQGLSFADHFCHLLVHGMLHLAGHDHETDDEADAMEALEIEILATLGVADPYSVKSADMKK